MTFFILYIFYLYIDENVCQKKKMELNKLRSKKLKSKYLKQNTISLWAPAVEANTGRWSYSWAKVKCLAVTSKIDRKIQYKCQLKFLKLFKDTWILFNIALVLCSSSDWIFVVVAWEFYCNFYNNNYKNTI